MANTGTIPASKVGNPWRLRREDADAWPEANKNAGGRAAKGKMRRKK
jgi:hypothetical protein